MEAHPADAARVLERLAASESGSLLQSVPARLAAPVLRQMLPLPGARCLEQLDNADVAGLLVGVGAQSGVALLRYFGPERRVAVLAQLPTALTLAYELLLGYPEDTVGAWMDPRALALPADMTVGESLERVRRADEAMLADPFVIDRNQFLLGYVELADLLRANPATTLSRQLRQCPHQLPAQCLLTGLVDHQGWHEASTLPVVERDGRLVGAFTHAALLRALALEQVEPAPTKAEGAISSLASAYWISVSALLQSVVGMLPVERHEVDS
jgi:magnesium transporter